VWGGVQGEPVRVRGGQARRRRGHGPRHEHLRQVRRRLPGEGPAPRLFTPFSLFLDLSMSRTVHRVAPAVPAQRGSASVVVHRLASCSCGAAVVCGGALTQQSAAGQSATSGKSVSEVAAAAATAPKVPAGAVRAARLRCFHTRWCWRGVLRSATRPAGGLCVRGEAARADQLRGLRGAERPAAGTGRCLALPRPARRATTVNGRFDRVLHGVCQRHSGAATDALMDERVPERHPSAAADGFCLLTRVRHAN
jgi:hypothetical protein